MDTKSKKIEFGNLLKDAKNVENGIEILDQCIDILKLLLEKNKKYGNSAFESTNIFSNQTAIEKVRGRIDSKLKRIKTSEEDDQEDTIADLIGYLIILRILSEKS